MLRIVLAEESLLLRDGLAGLLEQAGHEVLAAVDDLDSLVVAGRELRPDIVVTGIPMPPRFIDEGIEGAVELRRWRRGQPVVILGPYVPTAEALFDSWADGGIGYLLKERLGRAPGLLSTVTRVAAGDWVLDPELARQLYTRPPTTFTRTSDRRRRRSA